MKQKLSPQPKSTPWSNLTHGKKPIQGNIKRLIDYMFDTTFYFNGRSGLSAVYEVKENIEAMIPEESSDRLKYIEELARNAQKYYGDNKLRFMLDFEIAWDEIENS